MSTQRTLRHTGTFTVQAADGTSFQVEEFTEHLTITDLSGSREQLLGQRKYRHGRHPVNANDDGTFDVFTGGMHPVRCRRL